MSRYCVSLLVDSRVCEHMKREVLTIRLYVVNVQFAIMYEHRFYDTGLYI